MNKNRRKRIGKIQDLITDIRKQLQILIYEEQESLDQLPESLQESDQGYDMQKAIENMEEVISLLDDSYDLLEETKC